MPYSFPSLVTCLSLMVYAVLCLNVVKARKRYGIKAPATIGNPLFERVLRVQQNMMEQMLLFLPSLWIAASFCSAMLSGIVGMIWVVSRIVYAYDYYKDPTRRLYGFIVSFWLSLLLLAIGTLGVLVKMVS